MSTFVVYRFRNGFQKQADNTYGWLRSYNLTPSWEFKDGETMIRLPLIEVPCLRLMQKADPARWGNPPEPVAAIEVGQTVELAGSQAYGFLHPERAHHAILPGIYVVESTTDNGCVLRSLTTRWDTSKNEILAVTTPVPGGHSYEPLTKG